MTRVEQVKKILEVKETIQLFGKNFRVSDRLIARAPTAHRPLTAHTCYKVLRYGGSR